MKPSTEKRLLQSNRAARLLLSAGVTAGFFAAVCVVAQATILSDVVDRVFQKKQTLTDVASLLAVLLTLAFLRAVIIWISDVLAQRSASQLKGSLRQQLTQQIFALGPAYTQSESSGELVNATVEGVEILDEYITTY